MKRLGLVFALLLTLVAPLSVEAASDFPWGQCTWWAARERPDLLGAVWGNAWDWANEARWDGYRTTTTPVVGAVAVFQPGVQEADGFGHVAYVTAVGGNGWFQVSEMNFPWPGRVDYRWAHTGWGVAFIGWR